MLCKPTEADSGEIISLIERAGVFGRVDVECVQELLDAYLHKPDRGGYEFLAYGQDGHLLGIACYGPTPLAQGAFDLYWLCVAPEAQGRGIGRALMAEVEASIRSRGARMLVIETSGTPSFRPARSFYLSIGCQRQATIPDYYAPGDDLVIFIKRFEG